MDTKKEPVDAVSIREAANTPWKLAVQHGQPVVGWVGPSPITAKVDGGLTFISSEPVSTGRKDDSAKSRVDLVDPEFIEGIGNVLKFGADKYAAHNWRGGISFSRLLGATLRHAFAILRGEDVDSESKLPHVYHLGCSVMFLAWMMNHRKDLDDRYKY